MKQTFKSINLTNYHRSDLSSFVDIATDSKHAGLTCYLGYAIGRARHDKHLLDLVFESIRKSNENDERLKGLIHDIDGVVIFMKVATSKNRSDPTIQNHLKPRGILDV